ncbi:MAG TPA: hypothetical protein DCX07_06600 [Phycisphaerales bacterium]|nr:hypothetical protein [Phycisphaerales bacterium]
MTDGQDNLSLTDRELLFRLGWFTRVRWVMGLASLGLLVVIWYGFGIRFHDSAGTSTMGPAVNVVLLIFLYNAAFTFLVHILRVRRRVTRRIIEGLALGQIVCDMLAVCALVHFSGGIENFFVVLILLPLVIATELLPQPLAYATAGLGAGMIHALAWSEQQGVLPHVRVVWPGEPQGVAAPPLSAMYVLEVTMALTATIFATVFVASSISKRLRMRESELEEAYRKLHQADEAKSFFMRKAGHDLRAPLSAIHSILSAIEISEENLSEKSRSLMARVQARTRAMISMVDDLRQYSRLRSPGGLLDRKEVRLNETVSNTVDLFRQEARTAGVELACRVTPLVVHADEQLLRELATNLLANALQYTPRGGTIDVSLSRDGKEDGAVLSVADTGMGISDEAMESLFEEFFRAPEARKAFPEGTGLGLAICRQIVRLHGGRIEVSNRAGCGAVFTVHLPTAPPVPPSRE